MPLRLCWGNSGSNRTDRQGGATGAPGLAALPQLSTTHWLRWHKRGPGTQRGAPRKNVIFQRFPRREEGKAGAGEKAARIPHWNFPAAPHPRKHWHRREQLGFAEDWLLPGTLSGGTTCERRLVPRRSHASVDMPSATLAATSHLPCLINSLLM